jgi:hypothetical protein
MDGVKRWLQLIAVGHIVLGVLLPLVVQLELVRPYFDMMAQVFALKNNESASLMRFLIGVFGPTVASWGVLFWAVVTQSFRMRSKSGWWLMIAAAVVWAVYDSVYSSLYGLWIHAVINGAVFVAIVLPLWWVRREFDEKLPLP